jgi:hypothetical protein
MAIGRRVMIHEGPGGAFESMWVGDVGGGAKPGLLLFPNILGTKEWDFAKAEELAALGYRAGCRPLWAGQAWDQHGKRHVIDEGNQR